MDKEFFWQLLEPVHPTAAGFCRKLTGDRDNGDDLYQEVLLTAMRKFGTLKDPAAFRPWLFRILINTYKNRQRNPWWRRRVTLTLELLESSASNDPREKYDSRRWLRWALLALSPEDRTMIILYEIEGWPVSDLASTFKRPEGTIKARLARARRKMRQKLEQSLPRLPTGIAVSEARYVLQRSETTDR